MKRYEIITEVDARTLETGTTVALAPGGLVTPLARDTLKARRVTVVRDGGARRRDSVARADVRRSAGGDRAATTRASRSGGRSFGTCAGAGSALTTRGLTEPSRWTIRTSPGAWRCSVAIGRGGRRHRHRRRRPRVGDRGEQDRRHPRGDVRERDAGALRARAQRRQRPGARRHAGRRRSRRSPSSTSSCPPRCASRATSAAW